MTERKKERREREIERTRKGRVSVREEDDDDVCRLERMGWADGWGGVSIRFWTFV